MEFICLFCPGFISLVIHKYFYKSIGDKNIFLLYFIYAFVINFIISFYINFASELQYVVYNESLFTINFSFKYMLISLILSIILPIIYKLFQSNIKISLILKEKNDEK